LNCAIDAGRARAALSTSRRRQDAPVKFAYLIEPPFNFRDEAGRELHAFAGIPGEFGEGLPDAGTVVLVGGEIGRLAGGVHRVWVLVWDEGGPCDPKVVLGRGFERRAFLETLERAGVIASWGSPDRGALDAVRAKPREHRIA
jgi:hypothetical protein